ncbi:uncharacterized protein [Nicotiana tomentosiformis]|uniref:uncharacterized protein n=1 Tax=Nicotiana tomentosiformis TaxID=4098 RepID=UPI00388CCA43
MVVVQFSVKARNLLYNAISGEEYEKISSCDTTKEMWEKLEVTYEGTSKVKETRINMLIHDYELFQMKEGESIEEIFARFSKFIGDLKAFGKPYSSGDQVRNILRSLPTTWQIKDTLDLTLKESQKMLNELKRLKNYWELKLEVCEIERDVPQDEVQELQIQLNGMHESTSHNSVKSNQATYKSIGKGPARTKSTNTNTSDKSKTRPITVWHYYNKAGHKYSFCRFHKSNISGWIWKPKDKPDSSITNQQGPKQAWVTKIFKEVIKINERSVKFGDDSKGKILGTGTVPFNNNCDISEIYLVDGLNYNLLSTSQLCDSGYEVKFKKTGCAIKDDPGKTILPWKRYGNVYILDGIENLDSHICLASIYDDP